MNGIAGQDDRVGPIEKRKLGAIEELENRADEYR
jgi:hypothetical protein